MALLYRGEDKAHHAYEANPHIVEDEFDALSAFGVVPAYEFERDAAELIVPAA